MTTEAEIIALCDRDLEEGFKLLMKSFQSPIYHYIRRLLVSHEDTQDALQETFIKIYQHWHQFRKESKLSTWVYKIATNESLRIIETQKKKGLLSTEDTPTDWINKLMASDYIDYENELAVKFQAAILQLPQKQRLVFNLRYYEEMSYEEMATILNSSIDNLKVNYFHAKANIKNYIKNH